MNEFLKNLKVISPTGRNEIRQQDNHGSGLFASRRGIRPHYGEDYITIPGEGLIAPHNGRVSGMITVYKDFPEWKGLEIMGDGIISHIYYIFPVMGIIGTPVSKGDRIGYSQRISDKYERIVDHIHWQIFIQPSLLIKGVTP